MNPDKGKIPSFTLSEMMVVIAITAIVVAMAFTVLGLVQRQMKGIEINFSGDTRLELLEQSLWIDFNRYQTVTFNAAMDEIVCKTALDSVYYELYEDKVIKYPDTFRIAFPVKTFYMDGNAVENGRIDAILLETSLDTLKNKKLFVCKKNDAAQYMD
ncbi:PulJ/GspJ family protein [Sinomicrobium sp. M5D2P9]